jgi:hypothetical protein
MFETWGCSVEGSVVVTSPGGANRLAAAGVRNGQTWTAANQISLSNYVSAPAAKTYFAFAASADATAADNDVMPGVNVVSLKYRFTVLAGAAGAGTPTGTVGAPWLVAIPF